VGCSGAAVVDGDGEHPVAAAIVDLEGRGRIGQVGHVQLQVDAGLGLQVLARVAGAAPGGSGLVLQSCAGHHAGSDGEGAGRSHRDGEVGGRGHPRHVLQPRAQHVGDRYVIRPAVASVLDDHRPGDDITHGGRRDGRLLAHGDRAGVHGEQRASDDGRGAVLRQRDHVLAGDGATGGVEGGGAGDRLVGADGGVGAHLLTRIEPDGHGVGDDDVSRGHLVVGGDDGVGDRVAVLDHLGPGDGQCGGVDGVVRRCLPGGRAGGGRPGGLEGGGGAGDGRRGEPFWRRCRRLALFWQRTDKPSRQRSRDDPWRSGGGLGGQRPGGQEQIDQDTNGDPGRETLVMHIDPLYTRRNVTV